MPSDADAWAAIACDERVLRYLPVSGPPSPSDIDAWIARQIDEQEREGFSCWPVLRKRDGVLVGRCGLHRLPDGEVEIAWVFSSGVWGNGYANEAATAVMAFATEHLALARAVALVDPRNAASIALAHRLGMSFDRVVRAYRRDLLRYLTPRRHER